MDADPLDSSAQAVPGTDSDVASTKPKGTDSLIARKRAMIASLVANIPPPRLSTGDASGFIDLSLSPDKAVKSALASLAANQTDEDPEAKAKAEFMHRFQRHAAVPNDPRQLQHSHSRDFQIAIHRLVSQDDSEQPKPADSSLPTASSTSPLAKSAAAAGSDVAQVVQSPLRVQRETLVYHQAADRDSDPNQCSRRAYERFRSNLELMMAKKRMQAWQERTKRYEEYTREMGIKSGPKAADKDKTARSAGSQGVKDDDDDDDEYVPGEESGDCSGSGSESESGSSSSEAEDNADAEEEEEENDEDKNEYKDDSASNNSGGEEIVKEAEEAEGDGTGLRGTLGAFSQDSQLDLFANSNTAGSASLFASGTPQLIVRGGGQRLPSQLPDSQQATQYRRELSTGDDWFSTQESQQQEALIQSQLCFGDSSTAPGAASVGFTQQLLGSESPGVSGSNNNNAFPDFVTQAPLVETQPAAAPAAAAFPDFITQSAPLIVDDRKDSKKKTKEDDGIDIAAYVLPDSDDGEADDSSDGEDDDLAKALMLSGVVDNLNSQDDALQEMPTTGSSKAPAVGNAPAAAAAVADACCLAKSNSENSVDTESADSKRTLAVDPGGDDSDDDEIGAKIHSARASVPGEDSEASDSDDTGDDSNSNDRHRDKKPRKFVVSDDEEDSNQEEEDGDSEGEVDDDAAGQNQPKRRLRQSDFLEEEAELSGSDDGVKDDDEEDANSHDMALAAELEGMIDDDEEALGGGSRLRRQVARIQHAMQADEDRRQLDKLKELLLPDGEFADEADGDGLARKWRFNRWKELQERRDAAEAAASAGLGDACWGDGEDEEQRRREEEELEAEARAEQALRIERHKREQFLEQQEQQKQQQMLLLMSQESQTGFSLASYNQHQQQQHHQLLEDSGSEQTPFFRDMQARVLRETSNSASFSGVRSRQMLPPRPLPPQQQRQQQQQQQESAPNKRKNFAPIKRTGSFLTRSKDSSASLRNLVAKSGGGVGGSGLRAAVAAAVETKAAKSSTAVACFSVHSRKQPNSSAAAQGRKRPDHAALNPSEPLAKKMRSGPTQQQQQQKQQQRQRNSLLSNFYAVNNAAAAAADAAAAAANLEPPASAT